MDEGQSVLEAEGNLSIPRPTTLAFTPPAPPSIGLPGLIAQAARLNVLGDVKPILTAAGLSVVRPGTVSMRVQGHEEALAARLGCGPELIENLATPRLAPDGTASALVRWGAGSIHRQDLDMRRRRVSPLTLTQEPHARAEWMNRLLDYCPVSLERLVDTCPSCGRPLGWLSGWGVEHCDERRCRTLPPSGMVLDRELVDGYRSFAALVSPVPGEREAFVRHLHPDLRTLAPTTLADLTLRLGASIGGSGPMGRDALRLLPAETKARCAALGIRLLEDWPAKLRSSIVETLSTMPDDDGVERRRLRAALMSAAGTSEEFGSARPIVAGAVPEAFQEIGKAFAGMTGVMILGSAAARRLAVRHFELKRLVDAGLFHRETTLSGRHRRELYRRDEIEAAAVAWEGSVPIAAAERRLGIPRYAAERLISCGDLLAESHAFVLSQDGPPRLRPESIEAYEALLVARARGIPGSTHVDLVTAVRAVGGRLKPWRQVLDAIARGDLEVSLRGHAGPLSRRLLVAAEAVSPFLRMDVDEGVPRDFAYSRKLSQADAMSVLNLYDKNAPEIREAGYLRFEQSGRADLASIDAVLAIASAHMSLGEAVARSGWSISESRKALSRELGTPRSVLGWDRLDAEAILPS